MSSHDLTVEFLSAHPLALPQGEVDKDARGRVTVIGGHRDIPGAVMLAAEASLRAGAGKVQIATVKSTATPLAIAVPEARVIGLDETGSGDVAATGAAQMAENIQQEESVLLGPGMLDQANAGQLAASLLEMLSGPTFVVDAAALTGLRNHMAALKMRAGQTVLTPHAGEMATFLDVDRAEVIREPIAAARRAAASTGAVVVMKGSRTHIASPQGEIWHSDRGNVGLATSGSGDTLAGIIAGLLARGTPPLLAAQWGVYLHAEAGNRLMEEHGLVGYLAREIPARIPAIMMQLRQTA